MTWRKLRFIIHDHMLGQASLIGAARALARGPHSYRSASTGSKRAAWYAG